ncbi:MAG: hypothetical protein ACOC9Q_01490, partial [bacterium]
MPAELSEEQERSLWLGLRSNLCAALELEAGIIINTGILPDVPPRIQDMTGLQINELEERETQACTRDPADLTNAELRLNVRRLEWLSRVHLLAMRDAT